MKIEMTKEEFGPFMLKLMKEIAPQLVPHYELTNVEVTYSKVILELAPKAVEAVEPAVANG